MNILFCVPFWPHLYTPWLFREIAWMRSRGHGVSVISTRRWHDGQINVEKYGLQTVPVLQVNRQFQTDRQLVADLIKLGPHRLFTSTNRSAKQAIRGGGLRHGLHDWVWLKRVIAFARANHAQVIEAHWASEAAECARQIHSATGIPYVVRMWGGDLYRTPSPALPALVESAAAVCPASQFMADLLMGKRPLERLPQVPAVHLDVDKLRICHHGLPVEAIADHPVQQNDDLQLVGTIGRLDPEKRHCDLIEAVAGLTKEFPSLRLRIIGGGQLYNNLQNQAASLGIADRVELTGPRPWNEVIELSREHHIYVQTAEVEGFCFASLEGLSQGVPAILTRTGAHPQMVQEGVNGYIFDPGNVGMLRDHLRTVLSKSAASRQEMGGQSLRIANERFYLDKLMTRVEAIFNAVLANQPLPQ